MRILLLAATSVAALTASTLAFAQDAKSTPVAADPGDKVTCHAIAHEGMVVHRSECHTQKEWDRIQYESQQSIRDWQMQSLTQGPH